MTHRLNPNVRIPPPERADFVPTLTDRLREIIYNLAAVISGTANRVPYYDAGGDLTSSANLTFDGTRLTAAALTVDSPTLYVDATNNRVGIGTTSPADVLVVKQSTGEVRFGGGNGRTLSAYDSGVLANFDFTAVQTYFNSDFLIETGKIIKTANGSTGNLLLSTDDSSKGVSIDRDLILPKTSGEGIKVDNTTPTFPWHDILGSISTRPTAGGGATATPDYVVYRGNIYGWRFGTTAPDNHLHEAFVEYHIPHDWLPGTAGAGLSAYIHVHWSQIVVDTGGGGAVPGVAKWYFDITYADGHGTPGGAADPFISPITVSVTQQGSTTQYGHMIAEVAFANDGGTGGLLDYNTIQVDGLILVRIYRDPTDVADTLNQNTFVHFVDVHYQSTGIGTKQRAPNFYS